VIDQGWLSIIICAGLREQVSQYIAPANSSAKTIDAVFWYLLVMRQTDGWYVALPSEVRMIFGSFSHKFQFYVQFIS